MAQFQDMVITRAGLDMIAESQAGESLIFTKAKLGDGQVGEQSIPDLVDLINTKMTTELTSVTAKSEGHVEVKFVVENTELDVGFFVREVGIFAKVGEEGNEKLYGYANAGNYTNYLADKTVPIDSIITKIDLVIGNASNVAFTNDKSIVYVTLEDMENAVDEHDNSNDAHEPAFNTHNADANAHLDMVGATVEAAGKRGFVPAPTQGKQNALLAGDGTFHDLATEAQAKEGINDVNIMTPAKTKAAINALVQGIPIGDVVYRPFLMAGYVKANGATVNRSDYPTLVDFATTNNLWTETPANEPWKYGVGDGSSTMVLPDYRNRFIEGSDNSSVIAAGLPNITGSAATYSENKGFYAPTGALYNSTGGGNRNRGDDGNTNVINIDASRCNSIYGSSQTVQPPAITLIAQIKF